MIPDGASLGRVQHQSALTDIDLACDNSLIGRSRAESLIRIAMAGSIAQRRVNPHGFRYDHARTDYDTAQKVLSHLVGHEDEMVAYWRLLNIQTKNILGLEHVWERLERIAEALLDSKTLGADDVEKLMEL